jgi:putative transposase
MSRFIILAPGAVVESAGARYVISHILSLESILAKDEATGKTAELKIANLTPSSTASNSKVEVKEIALIDPEDWAAAERCLDQIRPLLFVRRTKEMVKSVALEMGIGLSSLYRKIEIYETTGLVSELIPRRSGGGRGRSRLTPEAEAVIASTIDEVYLNKQRRSIKKTADEISMRFHNAKLKPPHYNTVRNRIVAVAEKERDKKRLGARAASESHS